MGLDWKHILKLSPEDLDEAEKDELYGTITWLDVGKENLNREKSIALFTISQELLKYKGEQVETLLHELDELATKQGEEEAKSTKEDVGKNRKSSSIEYENLEQKYLDLKSKHKKQSRVNQKQLKDIEEMKHLISQLEVEKTGLERELQSTKQDDSGSEVSETLKDQHRELIETVHAKNKQISDLLHDIEETEKDNLVLREKLCTVRDELSVATTEIKTMSNKIESLLNELQKSQEDIQKLTMETTLLQEEISDINKQKKVAEETLLTITEEKNLTIEKLEETLKEKNLVVEDLKNKLSEAMKTSITGSKEERRAHVSTLKKLLTERDTQLLELQTKLQEAVAEMETTTNAIEQLNQEKEEELKKNEELTNQKKELRKQLKQAHERAQRMQEEVEHYEKLAEQKSEDYDLLVKKLSDDGEIELAEVLSELKEVKSQNRINEKQVATMIKNLNKLQDSYDVMEKENTFLREKLGYAQDEVINFTSLNGRQKQQRKELTKLKRQVLKFEEDNLTLRTEIKNLNQMISALHDQIMEMEEGRSTAETRKIEDASLSVGEIKKEENLVPREEFKMVVEENEALRKGLHEVLDSINATSSPREIKSETLERLLRALDAKHVSGWYHPAMRLQAELHNAEGINAELREQLRAARSEVEQMRKAQLEEYAKLVGEKSAAEAETLQQQIAISDMNTLDNLGKNIDTLLVRASEDTAACEELSAKMEQCRDDYENVDKQMSLLRKEYFTEKNKMEEAALELRERNSELSASVEALEIKVKTLEGGDVNLKHLAEVTAENVMSKRRREFVECELQKLISRIDELNKEYLEAFTCYEKKIEGWTSNDKLLRVKIELLERKLENSVEVKDHRNCQNALDELTRKYREQMRDSVRLAERHDGELELLRRSVALLECEKRELRDRLGDTLSRGTGDDLARRLAASEVNEISERQRANHVNSLYELVKDQLRKSEERFQEYETYNKEILHKNLLYQSQINNYEEKLQYYPDEETAQKLRDDLDGALKDKEALLEEVKNLRGRIADLEAGAKSSILWTSSKEQELLALQHQVVDLQSESDEKAVVSRLSMDAMQARKVADEWKDKYETTADRLEKCHFEWLDALKTIDEEKERFGLREVQLTKKSRLLEDFLKLKKQQYYGCVPLSSEETFVSSLKQSLENKNLSFVALCEAEQQRNENFVEKEQVDTEKLHLAEARKIIDGDKDEIRKLLGWQRAKKHIELDLIRYKRQSEFKDVQMKQINERIQVQNEQIARLEEELFLSYKDFEIGTRNRQLSDSSSDGDPKNTIKQSTQTIQTDSLDLNVEEFKIEIGKLKSELESKENTIEQFKNKLNDCESSITLLRKQMADKQMQIAFYEKHILDLQSKQREDARSEDVVESEEMVNLKATVKSLNEALAKKEDTVLHYQSLLKEDRDNHSLAAARMREEVRTLRLALADVEKEKIVEQDEPEAEDAKPKEYDQHVDRVHRLEESLEELKTGSVALESQLQASRQEALRWRSLANDRMQCLDQLRQSLDEQHQNELAVYKKDCEKWREEVLSLKELIDKHKNEILQVQPDLQNILKAKDDKIHELTIMFRQMKETMRRSATMLEAESAPKMSELEKVKGQLLKEHETLKKRFDQLLQKERSAREEIRDLKGQLLKRPSTSARSDKSDKSAKEQLQKKVASLEDEVIHLKDELAAQVAINDSHRVKIAEDFDRWKKQKQSQQTIDKLRVKLKEKDAEIEKMQQTCTGYRGLIERLEREKHGLENRIKALKTTNTLNYGIGQQQPVLEAITSENSRLIQEVADLKNKLELHQHHAGGLGATMLQEKLEAQERKLAIMELSSKGSVEVRTELERLQTAATNLQKSNLFLEAKNVELKMELEKAQKDLPRYKEQIQHLENYMIALKQEQTRQQSQLLDQPTQAAPPTGPDPKKISELERTVLILRRVVEKLQVENKRLSGGKRPTSERLASAENLRRDLMRLKERYGESAQRIERLERELAAADQKIAYHEAAKIGGADAALSRELAAVREEVAQKTHLLDKVKVLLHKASIKERDLLREIADLKQRLGMGDAKYSTRSGSH